MRASGSASRRNAKPKGQRNVLRARWQSLGKSLPVTATINTNDACLASIQPAPHVVTHDHGKEKLSRRDTKTQTASGTVSQRAGPRTDEPFHRENWWRQKFQDNQKNFVNVFISKKHNTKEAYAKGPPTSWQDIGLQTNPKHKSKCPEPFKKVTPEPSKI